MFNIDISCKLTSSSFALTHHIDSSVEQFCETVTPITLTVVRYWAASWPYFTEVSACTSAQLSHFTHFGVGVENTLHVVFHVLLPKQLIGGHCPVKVRPDWACETVEPSTHVVVKPVCEALFIQDLFSVLCYLSDPFLRFDPFNQVSFSEELFAVLVQPVEGFFVLFSDLCEFCLCHC